MAQIFSADARINNAGVACPDGVPTQIVSTVALSVPFETAKAKVIAWATVTLGAGANGLFVTLFRNVNAENVLVASGHVGVVAGAGQSVTAVVAGVDAIGDGRDVTYTLLVISDGVGNVVNESYIEATLLAG